MKKYSNPLHGKSLKELENLVSLVGEAEQAGCDLMNDLRSSNYYGCFDGALHTVEYRMILRKIELLNSLYLNLNIPALTEEELKEIRQDLDLVGDEEYSEFAIGTESDYYDDDFCNYSEVCYNGRLNCLVAKFTSLDGVGDFKECQLDCRGENRYDALLNFVYQLKDKDLLDDPSSSIVKSAISFVTPYSLEIEQNNEVLNVDEDFVSKSVFEGDELAIDTLIKADEDDFAILSELYYARSKKVGQALNADKDASDNEKKLLERVANKMGNLFYLVDTYSSCGDTGISDGNFFISYASLANMDSNEGEGVSMVLRGMSMKFYGFVAQELADRILSAEKKKRKEAKPDVNVRVKTL